MAKIVKFIGGIAFVIFMGVVVSSLIYQKTEPYKIIKERILNDPQVKAIFGNSVSFSFFVTGRFSENPVKGTRYKFSISGNNATGEVSSWTKRLKDSDKWEAPTILIKINNRKTIKLTQE